MGVIGVAVGVGDACFRLQITRCGGVGVGFGGIDAIGPARSLRGRQPVEVIVTKGLRLRRSHLVVVDFLDIADRIILRGVGACVVAQVQQRSRAGDCACLDLLQPAIPIRRVPGEVAELRQQVVRSAPLLLDKAIGGIVISAIHVIQSAFQAGLHSVEGFLRQVGVGQFLVVRVLHPPQRSIRIVAQPYGKIPIHYRLLFHLIIPFETIFYILNITICFVETPNVHIRRFLQFSEGFVRR